MQIVVLCGGQATRLFPLTEKIPKSMLKIAERPFLEHQVELFKKNKIFDIVLCIGSFGEQIEKYFGDGKKFGVNIKYSKEKEPLDTGGALKNAKNLLDDEFFIIYGDSYLLIDYQEAYDYFKKFNKLGLMTIYKNYRKIEPSKIIVKNNLIQKFDKDNPNQEGMIHTEFGLNIFKKEVLDLVQEKTFPIGNYFKKLIERNELLAYESSQRFYEIGCPSGLKATKDLIETKSP
ncbi:NTP transferase domain-containing protein [Patescibacteria group bacterium]|nr:NTP transferase domain-containing protein [Patescibacteria group bacterium]